jgi:membrane protein implicated in regulation of membrane protease activity
MNATPEPHGPVETDFEDYEDEGFGETLPVRQRRPFLTKWTALLMALVLGAVGFYVGVRVEKSKTTSTSSGGASALARAFAGTGGTSTTPSTSGTGGGFPGGGAFGGATSNATIGSVSSVKGDTLYVTETSGNTVKVKLSGSTSVTKSESASKSKIYPGDEVVITGSSSKGTVKATKVTDSGASSTGSNSTSSTGSSSAVSSLFGGA